MLELGVLPPASKGDRRPWYCSHGVESVGQTPVHQQSPLSSPVYLSVCLSVTFVHHTQAIEILSNVSTPVDTMAIYRHPSKILRRSSQGNTTVWGVEH